MRARLDSRQQRPRLSDLGHLRRRRKAYECRGEDRLSVDQTVGRLVELSERKRRL